MFWPLLAVLIAAGDVCEWQRVAAIPKASQTEQLSLDNIGQWTPTCRDAPARGRACNIVLSFRFSTGPGGEQFAILGVSDNYATITAPIRRFTVTSWRVDGLPAEWAWSIEGDGTVLPSRHSMELLKEMLRGKRITVRFVESVTGMAVERSFSLDGFPQAYARYRKMQQAAGGATI